jgi:hypothetical protein
MMINTSRKYEFTGMVKKVALSKKKRYFKNLSFTTNRL